MRSVFIILICLFTFQIYSQKWGVNTTSSFTNEALDIEVDSQGNSYVVGYFSGNISFESSIAELVYPGNQEVYISKYNSLGTLLWVKRFGGNYSDRGVDLVIDHNDQILVTGTFYDLVDFGGVVLQSSLGSKDIFILKLDEFGNVLWARKEGGDMSENVYSISVDNLNNVLVTGQFQGTAQIGSSVYTSYNDPISSLPSFDLFLAKYSPAGLPIWEVIGHANYEERGLAVTVDSQNNIFLTGQFSDTLNIAGIQIANIGYNVGFISKISPSGSLNWVNLLKAGFVLAYDIEVNNFDEIVVIGDYRGSFTYSNGIATDVINNTYFNKIFCLKIANDGTFIWGEALGSENSVSARSLAITSSKDIFITGNFSCFWSELRGSQTAYYNSVGFEDAYLWKISNIGVSEYIRQFGGKRSDKGNGVAIVNANEAVICGSYTEDINIMGDLSSSYSYSSSNFDLNYSPFTEPFHFYLTGDLSLNSFVTNSIDLNTPQYNYFDYQPSDSLTGDIISSSSSTHGCLTDILLFNDSTYSHLGPGYNYLWNNGDTLEFTEATSTGLYTVDVERIDECSSFIDSIVIYPLPNLPLLNDSLGLAINEIGPFYYSYLFCQPDSVDIWFSNLDSSSTIGISNSVTLISSDTLTHNYSIAGIYNVIVSDSFCINYGEFYLNFDSITPPDIIPYMVMVDEVDFNDSITVCLGEEVYFHILDSLENPTGSFYQLPSDLVVSENWITASSVSSYIGELTPGTTGWYTIDYFLSAGYDNLCGVDTSNYYLTDSFYIEVLPVPVASTVISGDSLCPDGAVYLTLSNTIPGFNWSGPGIAWVNSTGDSAQVTEAGVYHYSGVLIDTVSGCSSELNFVYNLSEKATPGVLLSPSDGLICPNDSLYMSVSSGYVSYNWNGPSGSYLSTIFEHFDVDQGFYFCVMEDADGCFLTSNIVELREYITPYLSVSPTNVICSGDSVLIEVIIQDTAGINWISPSLSSSTSVYVNQPGWYVCELTQCGVTILDSVLIIDGSFSLNITSTDSILCYDDTILITAPSGLAFYDWSDGTIGLSSIEIINEGSYSLFATNGYLCSAYSDTIYINYIEESDPPQVSDTILCGGGDLLIYDSIPASWFDIDTNWLSHSTSFQFLNLSNDTSVLVAYDVVECPNNYTQVNISVIDSIGEPIIYGDNQFCLNDSLILSSDTSFLGGYEWFLHDNFLSNSNEIVITSLILNYPDTIWLVQSNQCFSDSTFLFLSFLYPESINIIDDSIVSCGVDSLVIALDSSSISFINWQGSFGSAVVDTLELTSYSEGYIFAQGIGGNGCLTTVDSVYIGIDSLLSTTYIDDNSICENGIVSIGVYSNADSISWTVPIGSVNIDSSNFTVSLNDSTMGWYLVELFSYSGCMAHDSVFLMSNYDNTISIISDTTICEGSYIASSSEDTSLLIYLEYFGVTDSINLYLSQEIIYSVEDSYGCLYTDTAFITVINCEDGIPNVITANGDGVNDYFIIDEVNIYLNNHLVITNRWGSVVFEEYNYNNSFTGEGLNEGVYFYVFHQDYSDATSKIFNGTLTITR